MRRWFKFLWTACAVVSALAVCALPSHAQDLTGAAKVLTMMGRVSMLRDNAEWALNVGSVVPAKQIIVTGDDGYAKFQLSDGSTFEVFQNSRVVFRPTTGWLNLLDVLLGRVHIQIQHQNGPNHQRISTQTAVISVRGTTFDVVVEDDDTTFVSVDEGIVDIFQPKYSKETQLHAGESLRIYRDQPLAVRRVDKGSVGQAALRAAAQAVYDALYRRTAGATTPGSTPTGGGQQGDQGKDKNPPPPPPPAPAPAPPPAPSVQP